MVMLKRAGVSITDITQVYTAIVRSVLEYAFEVWHPGLTQELSNTIEHIQKRVLRIVLPGNSYEEALEITGLKTLYARREDKCRKFFMNMTDPTHKLNHLLPKPRSTDRLRSTLKYELPKVGTVRLKNSPVNYGLFNFQ